MKFSTFAIFSLFLLSASARSFFQQVAGTQERIETQDKPVPGNSPVLTCSEQDDNILDVEIIDLAPNPPLAGERLLITATGVLREDLRNGSTVDVILKYGFITLYKNTLDLCENAGQIDMKCPVRAGEYVLSKSVDIPKQIPPGMYIVIANAHTEDGRPITCLTATVRFT